MPRRDITGVERIAAGKRRPVAGRTGGQVRHSKDAAWAASVGRGRAFLGDPKKEVARLRLTSELVCREKAPVSIS